MSVTGFLMWAVFCAVVGLLVGATVSTGFNLRRNKASRADGNHWFRVYALTVGGGLFALNFVVRYLFWVGRNMDSGNYMLRAEAFLSLVLVLGLGVAAWFGVRQLRRAREAIDTVARDFDAHPGGIEPVRPELPWFLGRCSQGHDVPIHRESSGAYCQLDHEWVWLPHPDWSQP